MCFIKIHRLVIKYFAIRQTYKQAYKDTLCAVRSCPGNIYILQNVAKLTRLEVDGNQFALRLKYTSMVHTDKSITYTNLRPKAS